MTIARAIEDEKATRCPDCGSRTCTRDEDCVAHEDDVPYEDNDQRLGGWDNPYSDEAGTLLGGYDG